MYNLIVLPTQNLSCPELKVNLAAITGNNNGFVVSYSTTPDSVTILLKRLTLTGLLHVEAVVNGTQVVNKDVAVP